MRYIKHEEQQAGGVVSHHVCVSEFKLILQFHALPHSCVLLLPPCHLKSESSRLCNAGSARLRIMSCEQGLVAAWRALRHARALIRSRSGGSHDLLTTPCLAVQAAQQQQQQAVAQPGGSSQAVMFLNIWYR
jgi:hypothetical protein